MYLEAARANLIVYDCRSRTSATYFPPHEIRVVTTPPPRDQFAVPAVIDATPPTRPQESPWSGAAEAAVVGAGCLGITVVQIFLAALPIALALLIVIAVLRSCS